ncbi:MAG TPA: dihydrofolate reductase family protein [Rhizomicrobium sp.]
MRKLTAFINVSLDGYYADAKGDMRWAHKEDAEWNAFAAENAKGGGEMVFGRITYDLMASYWPTPLAMQQNPVVAERMNAMQKTVFSNTLEKSAWSKTRVAKGNIFTGARMLKQAPGEDMAILGSGSIVSQLTEAGLIDELQIAIHPLVIGGGKRLFDGVKKMFALKRMKSRAFQNGVIVAWYAPAA